MSAITLTKIVAKCKLCAYTCAQIDATREHALQVVSEAMDRHVAETHPPAMSEFDPREGWIDLDPETDL